MKTFKQWKIERVAKKAQEEIDFFERQLDQLKDNYDTITEILTKAGRL